jgi:hypothetical protein
MQCLAEPLEPHYGGGVIVNPDFNSGLQGWSSFGYGRVAEGASVATGNRYAAAVNRTRPYHSVSQKVYLQNDTHYTLSGLASHSCSVFFFFFLACDLAENIFVCVQPGFR